MKEYTAEERDIIVSKFGKVSKAALLTAVNKKAAVKKDIEQIYKIYRRETKDKVASYSINDYAKELIRESKDMRTSYLKKLLLRERIYIEETNIRGFIVREKLNVCDLETKDIVQITGISRATINLHIKQGKLKAYKIHQKKNYVKEEDLLKWLKENAYLDVTKYNYNYIYTPSWLRDRILEQKAEQKRRLTYKDDIIKLKEKGLTYKEIAQELDITFNSVRRIIWQMGKEGDKRYKKRVTLKLTDKELEEMLELHNKGVGITKIQEMYGRSTFIGKRLKAYAQRKNGERNCRRNA